MKKLLFVIIILMIFGALNLYTDEDDVMGELGLSDSQKSKIKDLVIDSKSKREQLIVKLKIKQLELREILMETDIPSKDVVKQKLKEIAEIEVEIRLLRFELDIEILKLLNDEQKKKYKYFRVKQGKDFKYN